MPLLELEASISDVELSDDILEFLGEADQRIDRFLRHHAGIADGFVPSDFVTVYRALKAIDDANLATGNSFCEWGSGFGVVASLAAMLEFNACGIEVERPLVDAARDLADDFGLPVEFIHGSFIPEGGGSYTDKLFAQTNSEFGWLVTDTDNAYDELGLDPDDFDIVFAFPWPGEEYVIDGLFEKYAANGALLLTHNQFNSVRLRRKVSHR